MIIYVLNLYPIHPSLVQQYIGGAHLTMYSYVFYANKQALSNLSRILNSSYL